MKRAPSWPARRAGGGAKPAKGGAAPMHVAEHLGAVRGAAGSGTSRYKAKERSQGWRQRQEQKDDAQIYGVANEAVWPGGHSAPRLRGARTATDRAAPARRSSFDRVGSGQRSQCDERGEDEGRPDPGGGPRHAPLEGEVTLPMPDVGECKVAENQGEAGEDSEAESDRGESVGEVHERHLPCAGDSSSVIFTAEFAENAGIIMECSRVLRDPLAPDAHLPPPPPAGAGGGG